MRMFRADTCVFATSWEAERYAKSLNEARLYFRGRDPSSTHTTPVVVEPIEFCSYDRNPSEALMEAIETDKRAEIVSTAP